MSGSDGLSFFNSAPENPEARAVVTPITLISEDTQVCEC